MQQYQYPGFRLLWKIFPVFGKLARGTFRIQHCEHNYFVRIRLGSFRYSWRNLTWRKQ